MLKFEHNMGGNAGFTFTKFGGARSRDRNFGGRKLAKSGKV